jgi:hypothetical protein
MQIKTNTINYCDDEVIDAAVDLIRNGNGDPGNEIVSVWELFQGLAIQFGDQFDLSDGQNKMLTLIAMVADAPGVELLGWGSIDFGWRGKNHPQ